MTEKPTDNNIAALAVQMLSFSTKLNNCEINNINIANAFNDIQKNFTKGLMEMVGKIEILENKVADLEAISADKFKKRTAKEEPFQ